MICLRKVNTNIQLVIDDIESAISGRNRDTNRFMLISKTIFIFLSENIEKIFDFLSDVF